MNKIWWSIVSKALERSRNTPTVVSRAKRLYFSDGLEHGTLNSFYQIQTGSDEFNHAIIHYFFKKVDHIWRIFPDITTIDVSCKNNERKGGQRKAGWRSRTKWRKILWIMGRKNIRTTSPKHSKNSKHTNQRMTTAIWRMSDRINTPSYWNCREPPMVRRRGLYLDRGKSD